MTADDEEIEQAKEEGIFVHPAQTLSVSQEPMLLPA